MVNAGIIHKYEFIISRAESAKAQAVVSPEELILSPTQNRVFQDIMKLMKSGEPKAALLKGITGSGKTSVFIKLIHEAVKSGKTALMLVPEISLTPQTVANFQAMFGKTVAVLHSGLSVGQRADEYKRIRNKEAQIVIGTRSAVFAPLTNIGIIVIDEEGEHTYKSEKSPRYIMHGMLLNNAAFTIKLYCCLLPQPLHFKAAILLKRGNTLYSNSMNGTVRRFYRKSILLI